MGTVDLKVIGERLAYLEQLLTDLRQLPTGSFDAFISDWRNGPTAESLLRRAVEAVLDVARHVLSRGFGLGALEYREVARHAGEKNLITEPELAETFLQVAGFRNRLTHHYEDVTSRELFEILSRHLPDLEALADDLKRAAVDLAKRQSELG